MIRLTTRGNNGKAERNTRPIECPAEQVPPQVVSAQREFVAYGGVIFGACRQ